MTLSRLFRILGTLAIAVGAGCLSYVATVMLQAREHRASYVSAPSSPVASAPRSVGAAIGEIRIERLGIDAVVTEGDSDAVLDLGPGHLPDTPWMGERGNIVIAGHRDTTFRPLKDVRAGDIITLAAGSRTTRYRVSTTQIVKPTDVSVLKPGKDNSLTLITCYPFYFIGHAPKRFIVRAVEIPATTASR
jgi:sortase A